MAAPPRRRNAKWRNEGEGCIYLAAKATTYDQVAEVTLAYKKAITQMKDAQNKSVAYQLGSHQEQGFEATDIVQNGADRWRSRRG